MLMNKGSGRNWKISSRNSLQTTTFLMLLKNLSLMLVLVVHVEMKKSRAKERIFLFVMILVNGTKKPTSRIV
jgi:hypothetical protein